MPWDILRWLSRRESFEGFKKCHSGQISLLLLKTGAFILHKEKVHKNTEQDGSLVFLWIKRNYKETNENLRFVLDLQLKIHLH